MKIGIFHGSSTGNTANAAKALKSELDSVGDVDLSVRHRKISFLVLCWGMTDCCSAGGFLRWFQMRLNRLPMILKTFLGFAARMSKSQIAAVITRDIWQKRIFQ